MSEEKHARKSRRRRPALDIYTTEAEIRHALEDGGRLWFDLSDNLELTDGFLTVVGGTAGRDYAARVLNYDWGGDLQVTLAAAGDELPPEFSPVCAFRSWCMVYGSRGLELDILTKGEIRIQHDGGSGFAFVLEDISRMGYRFYKGQRRLEPYLEGTELGRPYLLAR